MIKIDNLPEARENKSFQVGIGFGLAFDGWEGGASLF